jgi:hypothetical protein
MKRIPSVAWAFFGLAVVIYLVYLLNRGVYVGSAVGLNVAPIFVMSLEKGRSVTGAEVMATPTPHLTDAQIIALAQAQGRTAELDYIRACKYLHFTGISISLGLDSLGIRRPRTQSNSFAHHSKIQTEALQLRDPGGTAHPSK